MPEFFDAGFSYDNLIWTNGGEVWAVWTLETPTYFYLSSDRKEDYFRKTCLTLQGLPDRSMLMSLCRDLSKENFKNSMTNIAPTNELNQSRAEELSEELDPGYSRHYFVAACLSGGDRSLTKSIARSLEGSFGLKPLPPSEKEISMRKTEMEHLSNQLSGLALRETTATEIDWILERSICRGIQELWDNRNLSDGQLRSAPTSQANMCESRTKGVRFSNNFVKIDSQYGESFQTFLALSGFPVHGWQHPGHEWLSHVDTLDIPVDWHAQIRSVDNRNALSKTTRRKKNLFSQDKEYISADAVPAHLQDLKESIDELEATLDSDPTERLLEVSIFLSLAETSEIDLNRSVDWLVSLMRDWNLKISAPVGGQMALFKSCQLGGSETREVSDYKHFLLVNGLASIAPFAGSVEVGTPGFVIGTAAREPVTFWQGWGPEEGEATNVLSIGDMGSGKSTGTKIDLANTLFAGGQVVVVDQTGTDTRKAEYIAWAEALPRNVSTNVVQLGDRPSCSLDPMQIFSDSPESLKEHTVAFLLQLVGAGTLGTESADAGEAVEKAASTYGKSARMHHVVEALLTSDKSRAVDLGEKLNSNYVNAPYGRMVFGDADPVSLASDLIIFDMPGLNLPSDKDLSNETLAAQIEPSKRFSQAILYLVACISRKVVFRDAGRFSVLNIDEASYFLKSPSARDLIMNIQRSSRRTNSCVSLATQSPEDNFDGTEKFFSTIFVYKPTCEADAYESVKLLELEPSDVLVEDLMSFKKGECLMKDPFGRVGRIQRSLDPNEALRMAGASNPNEKANLFTGHLVTK